MKDPQVASCRGKLYFMQNTLYFENSIEHLILNEGSEVQLIETNLELLLSTIFSIFIKGTLGFVPYTRNDENMQKINLYKKLKTCH